jgi:diguanylate cyclase (GGDEF)-like protein/PAS domain S-box-containing protein
VGLRADVSEMMAAQRTLQLNQAHLQAIIDTTGVAIITLDERALIRSANITAQRMLGFSEAELIQRDLGRMLDLSARVVLLRQLRMLRNGNHREVPGGQREIALLQRNGQPLTVQLALAEVRGGDERLFVAALTDISERKRFELELQQANEQLLRLSTTDALTELANRRLLMQRLDDEWRRAARSREPLSLLLVDVDFFKLYNDHYGHQAGDSCLQAVARVLNAATHRHTDLAARYGGEEFVLLLPQTGAVGAMTVADRVTQALRERALEHAKSPLGPHLSLSMGLACGLPDASANAGQWLAQADAALYQAKALGRNRVVVAPPLGPLPSAA